MPCNYLTSALPEHPELCRLSQSGELLSYSFLQGRCKVLLRHKPDVVGS